MTIEIILYTIALLLALFGMIGAILPILPGTWLSLAGLAIGYFSSAKVMSTQQILIWSAVCVAVTVVDMFLPVLVTKYLGGSKSGMVGATIGMVAGLVAFPPFGVVVGPFVGAVMGEMINNKDNVSGAFKLGFGTFVAFIFGTGIKFIFSVGAFWILISAMYPKVESFFSSIMDKIAFLG